jgi:uncharacterized membrane protein (DUF2068 family)
MSSSKRKNQRKSQTQSKSSSQSKSPSQPKQAPPPPKAERGLLLTILLILLIASGIFSAIGFYSMRSANTPVDAPIVLAMGIAHAVLNVIAAAGIWLRQKWGVYLLLFSALVGAVAGVLAGVPLSIFAMVVPVVVIIYLLEAKKNYFV